ncbi:MAG: aquaporin [Acidimicrobiia bacterium]
MSQRGRVFVAEAVGTAILVLGGPGTAIFAGGSVGTLGVALAFGLSLLVAVYLIGAISGCHINPAVTLGMWFTKRTTTADVPWYLGGQVVGAAVASGLIWAIVRTGENAAAVGTRSDLFSGASNGYGSHSPAGYDLGAVMIAEVVFTAVLVLVVLGVTRSSVPAGFAAIPIGLTLALVHLISIPIDNTSVNPARSLATAIFAKGFAFEQLWVFIVFPAIGGLIGALGWQVLAGEKLSLSWPKRRGARRSKKAPAKKAPAKKARRR